MRIVGALILILGVVGLFATSLMDTSVSSSEIGRRIHNIGLMNDKQNLLLIFAVATVVGAIFVARRPRDHQSSERGSVGTRRCPFCAENIRSEAKVCRFCGNNLDQSNTKLSADVAAPVQALQAAGFQVASLGNDKWRVAHRTRQVLLYPNSSGELLAIAKNESSLKRGSLGEV